MNTREVLSTWAVEFHERGGVFVLELADIIERNREYLRQGKPNPYTILAAGHKEHQAHELARQFKKHIKEREDHGDDEKKPTDVEERNHEANQRGA